jgi:hypothetical protein
MLGVCRLGVLEFQMDEASGKLDKSLVKGIIRGIPPVFKPEMLQYVVRLVIALRIEALEIPEITGIETSVPSSNILCS